MTRVTGKTFAAMSRKADEDATASPLDVPTTTPVANQERAPLPPGIYSSAQAEWLRRLDALEAPPSRRIITFLDSCADLGVSWSLNKVLLARMRVGGNTVEFLAVEPDGRLHIPWSIGGRKDEFRSFAETLAAGIEGAIVYETPKLWNVALAGKKPLGVLQLLGSLGALRLALEALHTALDAAGKMSPE